MAKQLPEKLYDLIPSQQTMYIMIKYSIHKQVTQIPSSVTVKQKLDFDLLTKALNIEIARNDALRLRFIKTKEGIKQYFIPEFELDTVEVLTFNSEQEQEAYFAKDASTPVRFLKDETFRVKFFRAYNGDCGIYLNISHIVTDALGAALFFSDLLKVYKALSEGGDMPEPMYSYEQYMLKEFSYLTNEKLRGRDREFYINYWKENGEPFYAAIHGPAFLEKARRKDPTIRVPKAYDPIHDKSGVVHKFVPAEKASAIYEYCKQHRVVPENLLLYALRAHASKINYRTPDVLTMLMCSRRATYKEKNMGGCITQPLQIRVITPETDTFEQAVDRVASCRNSLIRHMNFPYLESRVIQQKIYNYATSQAPSSFMFSWIPVGLAENTSGFDFSFKAYSIGRYIMPLYIFAVPDARTGGIDFYYMHRLNMITVEQIELLHENAMKVIDMGMENPEITVREILNNLTDLPLDI